ncbi:siderophore ABC transporter substrate-binding protein [Metaclostridioides mangenotii]|uniref:siderophore ABC transporter substrate-binding protein n=1 Tax=Metaclostridioides mangenotii TaxID=1540 RepID=UPI00047FA12A|nr:siderophore ABC transporter substrate-binding protein [Clostridioides mangenotii]
MKKLFSMLLVLTMTVVIAAGCSPKSDKKEESKNATESSESAGEVVFKHSKGETKIPKNPKKVVVFDMGILDTMQALDVDADTAVPLDSLPKYLSSFEKATNVGGIKEPDMEAIFAFEPDAIFISGRQEEYYDKLSDIAPTVYVDLDAKTYMDDFKKNTTEVAELFGKEDDAKNYLDKIDKKIEKVSAMAEKSDKKSLIILTNDGSLSAYGKGSRFGIIHDVLNLKAADEKIEASTHGQEVNFEYVSKINPDILFVVDRAVVTGGQIKSSDTLNNDLVKNTNAGKNDKIINLDPEFWYLSGGGLLSVDGMINEVESALE